MFCFAVGKPCSFFVFSKIAQYSGSGLCSSRSGCLVSFKTDPSLKLFNVQKKMKRSNFILNEQENLQSALVLKYRVSPQPIADVGSARNFVAIGASKILLGILDRWPDQAPLFNVSWNTELASLPLVDSLMSLLANDR